MPQPKSYRRIFLGKKSMHATECFAYAGGVKANVLVFDGKPAQEKP